MRLRLSLNLLAVVAMTAMVGAAPTSAPVADAAMKGDHAAIRALLQQGADVNAAQGDGMSALHWAADRGDADPRPCRVTRGLRCGVRPTRCGLRRIDRE